MYVYTHIYKYVWTSQQQQINSSVCREELLYTLYLCSLLQCVAVCCSELQLYLCNSRRNCRQGFRMWKDVNIRIFDMFHSEPGGVSGNLYARHVSFTCDMSHSRVTWLIDVWHDLFTCDTTHSRVTWLIHVWHESFTCDMTHSRVTWFIDMWHDSFTCDMVQGHVTRIAQILELQRSIVNSVVCLRIHAHVTQLIDTTHWRVTWLIHMWHDTLTRNITQSVKFVTHLYVEFVTHSYDMWQGLRFLSCSALLWVWWCVCKTRMRLFVHDAS